MNIIFSGVFFGKQSNHPEPPQHLSCLHPQFVFDSLIKHIRCKFYKDCGSDSPVALQIILLNVNHQIRQPLQEKCFKRYVHLLRISQFE